MVLSDERIKGYMRRLLMSRMRILCSNGFYGLLIMHMKFALDEECETAATDGVRIFFNPDFLDSISDSELDFILMHEILHVVLQHCSRRGDRDSEQFNIACDIVVNSNILKSCGMDENEITLEEYGGSMHLAPDGKEGYEYTAEQVYEMLSERDPDGKKSKMTGTHAGESSKKSGSKSDNAKAGSSKGGRSKGGGSKDGLTLKGGAGDRTQKRKQEPVGQDTWDDHTKWEKMESDEFLKDVWIKRFEDACEAIQIRDPSNTRGLIPGFAVRLLKELKKPQTNWRTILNNFVQEEIADYSFMPPDRRMDECVFFLPDFNEKEDIVSDILFMIDTSGSMSDEMVTAAYSEVKGAIDQFDGKLKGWLGFFDAAIVEPKPFSDEGEFRIIEPIGGGGTDFMIIFEYVRDFMQDKLPASIIILTDGYAPFPKESAAMGIPVLWLLNNEKVDPSWGKVARITI